MLGRFLEFSIATPDIRASMDFYTRLGFSEAEVGETWTYPYAVVTDGRVCLGLHQSPGKVSSVTFVKPDLLKYLSNLEALGIKFETRHLGNDVFNEVTWSDPSGHPIHLIEARTFSPSKRATTATSLCGYFEEIALPTPDTAASSAYWEQLGFVAMDEPDAWAPHVSCTSDSVDIGLYEPGRILRPSLLFEADDLDAQIARLSEVGVHPTSQISARPDQTPTKVLYAPEGTPILMTANRGD